MPFNQPFPRSFTSQSILTYAPSTSGVFGISDARQWIYIGETDNIQLTLLSLVGKFQELNSSTVLKGFVFEICDCADRIGRHHRLILEYEPAYNRNGLQRMTLE